MASELHGVEARMDAANLYREEIFSDRRVGTIRLLTPVTAEGATALVAGTAIYDYPDGVAAGIRALREAVI